MTLPLSQYESFLEFLIEAKQHTYAAQGDDATVLPLLPGSKQLEWQNGEWLYRDNYFGMAYFVGQETVYFQRCPIWSMSYAGGIVTTIALKEEVSRIYSFLREAMRQINQKTPYRGPQNWQDGKYLYTNTRWGDNDAFGVRLFCWFHYLSILIEPESTSRYSSTVGQAR